MSLDKLFYPRGVAVVGSTGKGKLAYHIIRQMLDGGFSAMYAVNPKAQGLDAVSGHPSLLSIPEPVDMAVIASPPATLPRVLADCHQAGIATAVIITAGFSEIGNPAAEDELAQLARGYGIRFVGPNCAGIINTRHRLAPTLETLPPAGGVSLIAQSGAVGGVFLAWAKEFGLGVSKFVSYGNGADLREVELLRYMADDPDTSVVALYIESTSNGPAFMEAIHACTQRKPLVVIKSGRTTSGQRATLSHTGSMAGADAVYDAALAQGGAIRVHTVEELFDACKAFSFLPRLRGNRVAIVTNSGGPGVMAADWAERVGLQVTEPSEQIREELATFLPPHCAFKNPIDLTVEGTEEGYRRTLLALLREYDVALALNIAPAYLDSIPLARGVCQAAQESGKPVATAFLPARIVAQAIPYLQERGIPNFATGERGATALYHLAQHGSRQDRRRPMPTPDPVGGTLPGAGQMLEPEAMAWLQQNGIPVPPFRMAESAAEAVRAAEEIGFPVVLKVVSPQILHKSDFGGVVLNVSDPQQATNAFEKLQAAAAGRDFRGVVIYPMIDAVQEVLLGIVRDPQFGPVVAFGLGGIYTEVWRDLALRVAPLDLVEANAMIRQIRGLPLLQGARGRPQCDLDSLAEALVTFSQLPFRYPEIAEIDLNPVFLLTNGLVVADARVIRRAAL